MFRSTLITLNPDELHYYSFILILDRCDENGNTFEDPFVIICVLSKIKDVDLKEFNMVKGKFKSKTLVKLISL